MFSVTCKENECKSLSDWLLHRFVKSEVLSVRVALLCFYFALCCLFPAQRFHVPIKPFLWVFSHMKILPLCALDPHGPLPPPCSLVWEVHKLTAGAACMALTRVFLIANTEHIITKFTHLWANKHPH